MAEQEITISLPEEILQEVETLAAQRQISVSQLAADALEELIARETSYDLARQRNMALLDQGLDLGTGGKISWTRDELHER